MPGALSPMCVRSIISSVKRPLRLTKGSNLFDFLALVVLRSSVGVVGYGGCPGKV
jgi:hypothetical protein